MNDPFKLRDHRAKHLTSAQPHAAELLTFYRHILSNQQPVYSATKVAPYLAIVDPSTTPMADITLLPVAKLTGSFREFIHEVRQTAPEITTKLGTSILAVDAASVLQWFLHDRDTSLPQGLEGYTPTQLAFYPRAFLQPVMEAMVETLDSDRLLGNAMTCPACGARPQVSVLQDEHAAKGQRRLLCSLCSFAWRFPRVTCPHCRESSSEKLFRHENDSVPHISVDECTTCHHYIKSIDLRKDGRAEPCVDELASVELDLWASERNLTKVQLNILGL